MNDYIWEINGVSLELDMEEAETAENYQKAFKKFGENEKKLKSSGNLTGEFIRDYCHMFRTLYDDIFGGGTSEKIFSGIKDNARKYDEVYINFLEFVRNQALKTAERKNAIVLKYSPKRK